MSERSYIVYIDDLSKLSFEEFYKDFLNNDGEYEESYGDDKDLMLKTRNVYDTILDEITYLSSDYFYDRHITWAMTKYVATIGMPVKVSDISGWSPVVTILSGKSPHKYVKHPHDDLEKRFGYMIDWAKECGLELGKPEEK